MLLTERNDLTLFGITVSSVLALVAVGITLIIESKIVIYFGSIITAVAYAIGIIYIVWVQGPKKAQLLQLVRNTIFLKRVIIDFYPDRDIAWISEAIDLVDSRRIPSQDFFDRANVAFKWALGDGFDPRLRRSKSVVRR